MNRIELLKQTFPSWAEVGPCQKTEGHQEYIDLPAYEGQTLLEYAIRSRSVESLGKVLELGADPNGKNLQGETPLNIAIQLSFKKAVRILIDNGADIELTGKDGKKPILNALQCAGSGNTDIIEALLKENVKIDEVDNNGRTTLDYLKIYHREIEKDTKYIFEVFTQIEEKYSQKRNIINPLYIQSLQFRKNTQHHIRLFFKWKKLPNRFTNPLNNEILLYLLLSIFIIAISYIIFSGDFDRIFSVISDNFDPILSLPYVSGPSLVISIAWLVWSAIEIGITMLPRLQTFPNSEDPKHTFQNLIQENTFELQNFSERIHLGLSAFTNSNVKITEESTKIRCLRGGIIFLNCIDIFLSTIEFFLQKMGFALIYNICICLSLFYLLNLPMIYLAYYAGCCILLLPIVRLASNRIMDGATEASRKLTVKSHEANAREFRSWLDELQYTSMYSSKNSSEEEYVLYLRSFIIDENVRWFDESLETLLAQALCSFGKFVAVGDNQLELGPYIVSTTDETWKERVEGLAGAARYILLTPAPSEGVVWEMEQIRKHQWLDKTIIVMPPDWRTEGIDIRTSEIWKSVTERIEFKDWEFPEYSPAGGLLRFDNNGRLRDWGPLDLEIVRFDRIVSNPVSAMSSNLFVYSNEDFEIDGYAGTDMDVFPDPDVGLDIDFDFDI